MAALFWLCPPLQCHRGCGLETLWKLKQCHLGRAMKTCPDMVGVNFGGWMHTPKKSDGHDWRLPETRKELGSFPLAHCPSEHGSQQACGNMGQWDVMLVLREPFQVGLKGHQQEHRSTFWGYPDFDTPYEVQISWVSWVLGCKFHVSNALGCVLFVGHSVVNPDSHLRTNGQWVLGAC